jgi:hypothetical protein
MPSNVQSKSAEHGLHRIFLLLTACAAGMATLLALLPAAGHDQLWFLLMAHRWLQGSQLYGPQVFDSNPPGIVWLSAIPILLAHALRLPITIAAKLVVILAESSASLLSLHFLRYARGIKARYELLALLFAAFLLFYLAPARDFGQRDHILSFLVLPYILAATVDPKQHRLTLARCLAGITAATGICLKPHHALVILAVELALLLNRAPQGLKPDKARVPQDLKPGKAQVPQGLKPGKAQVPQGLKPDKARVPQGFSLGSHGLDKEEGALAPVLWPTRLRRLLRPEPILIALLGLLYLAAIHRLTPLYFTLALPTLHDTYWAIGNLTLPALLFQAIELVLLAAISLILFARTSPRSPVVALLLVAGLASTAAYLLQGTGWYYQQLPAIAFFGAALTLQLLDLLAAHLRTIPRWLTLATAALCLLALVLTAHFTGYPFTRARIYAPVFADASMPDPSLFTPNTSVAILTTSVEASMMSVERYDLTWAQRTNNLWLLPAILRSESPGDHTPNHIIPPAQLAALDAMQHRWMVEDLTRWHPTLILVERCQDPAVHCQKLEDRHDNLLAWFQRDPAFATLWTHYTYAGERGHFGAYILNP